MAYGVICQSCGIEAPSKHVSFHQNIGMLIMRHSRSFNGSVCKSCLHSQFWAMTGTTIGIGWLGMISLVIAPIFVINNLYYYLGSLGMPPVPLGARPPEMNEAVWNHIQPFTDEIFGRINQNEPLDSVCQAMAQQIGVTPGQVWRFVMLVVEASKQQQRTQPPPGPRGFEVLPPPIPPQTPQA